MMAVRQLEDRINRLGRTITVNLKVNEKGRRGSDSGGGGGAGAAVAGAGLAAALSKPGTSQKIRDYTATTKALYEKEGQSLGKLERLEKGREKVKNRMLEDQKEINNLVKQRMDLEKKLNTVYNSNSKQTETANKNRLFGGMTDSKGNKRSPAQAMNDAKIKTVALERQTAKLGQRYRKNQKLFERFSGVTARYWGKERRRVMNTADAYDKLNKKIKEQQETQKKLAAKRSKIGRGLAVGGGVAAASAFNQVPVLGEAVTGGLVAKLSGASVAAGALAGAIVGIGVASAAAISEVTRFQNALVLQRRALALSVTSIADYELALAAVRRAADDFIIPIGDATRQFARLNASAAASGFTVSEVEKVYRGLASANLALGGSSEDLAGILLASQQVFSKGKVAAEELRGQIGERLVGAFTKFAQANKLSSKDLDEALSKGEVNLKDFVTFALSLLDEYEDAAKVISDAPEKAGERLIQEMDKLKEALGPILSIIGNQFTDMAVVAVKALTDMVTAASNAFKETAIESLKLAKLQTVKDKENLALAGQNYKKNPNFITKMQLDNALNNYITGLKVIKDLEEKVAIFNKPVQVGKPATPIPNLSKTKVDEQGTKNRDNAADLLRTEKQRLALTKANLDIAMQEDEVMKIRYTMARDYLKLEQDRVNRLKEAKTLEQRIIINEEVDIQKTLAQKVAFNALAEVMKNAGTALGEGLAESMQDLDDMKDMFKNFWKGIANSLPEEPLDIALNASVDSLKVALEESIVGVLDVAINRAEDLGKVLTDIGRQLLSDVGRLFINAALGQIPFPTFDQRPPGLANGGPMTGGQPYVVGERGPELIVPAQAGTVYNANAFDAARASMQSTGQAEATNSAVAIEASEAEAPLAPSDITVRYETSVINAVSYVTDEQFQQGMRDSANQARALTYKELRNRPAIRAKAGVR